MIRNG